MSRLDAYLAGRNLFGERVTSFFGLLALGERFTFAGIVFTEPREAMTKIGANRYADSAGRVWRASRKSAVVPLEGGSR